MKSYLLLKNTKKIAQSKNKRSKFTFKNLIILQLLSINFLTFSLFFSSIFPFWIRIPDTDVNIRI